MTMTMTADGAGLVSHAGARLLADLADASTLTGRLSTVSAGLSASQTAHDPGRLLTCLGVAIGDGGMHQRYRRRNRRRHRTPDDDRRPSR
jgi:hypothetical protein